MHCGPHGGGGGVRDGDEAGEEGEGVDEVVTTAFSEELDVYLRSFFRS